MTRAGALYLQARDSAAFCRQLHAMAVEDECLHQAPVFAREAANHTAEAARLRTQLAAARKLGLRGPAGAVPPGYFADSQTGSANPHSAIRTPQS